MMNQPRRIFDQRDQTVLGPQTNIVGDQHIYIAGKEQSYLIPKRDASGLRPVRIFVASPGDVADERNRLTRIVEQLNRGTAKRLGLVLELIRWETHAVPDMGRPQQVILDQLTKVEWDIFIGILWLRFGTPTGAAEPATGAAYASGTEEEFQLVRQMRKQNENGWPKIMFYRCGRPPKDMFHFDADQFQKVAGFFKEFGPGRAHEGLIHQYITVEEFEDAVREHLESVLWELNG